ncbi:MAG TPA: TonB-dependent receptor, partial [Steroidobacteraceae bacterium]
MATSSLVRHLASIAFLWVWMGAAEAQSVSSVVDVLGALRGSGVDVIYSTDLVTPSMQLVAPLRSQSALDRAREALRPYGLILRSVSLNRYVVTRAPDTPAAAPVPQQPAADIPPQVASALAEISVYASQYTLGGSDTGEPKSFSSVDIDRIPGDHDNALRATRLLPGVASNGSSRAYIRGSSLDDVLLEFDGVTLFDPFHMKDFQSLLSAFDTEAIDRMDVYSGGFPVQYGTRSGAVIDIAPRTLSSGYECTIGASKLAYEASSVGRAEVWPVDWLATVRNSAPEVAERPGNGRTLGAPQFTESVGRVRWRPGVDTAWTLGWLLLDNRTSLATIPTAETSVARYRDEYVWTAFDADVLEGLHSHAMLALTDAGRTRDGSLRLGGIVSGRVGDNRSFSGGQLRNDWTYRVNPRLTFDYGLEATESSARLRYGRIEHFNSMIVAAFGRPSDNSLHAIVTPEEMAYATWASIRRRWAPLEVELGVRFDAQKYESFAARQQWSPRINVRYDIAARWHLYGSWGHFTQAQRPEEWRVEEAQAAPDLPELAIHSTLGVAYESSHQAYFSMEVYRKRWTNVSPYYDNTLQKVTLVPDLIPDRVRIAPADSRSMGVELSAHRVFSASL